MGQIRGGRKIKTTKKLDLENKCFYRLVIARGKYERKKQNNGIFGQFMGCNNSETFRLPSK